MKHDLDDYKKYFDVLEIPADASLQEIRKAYRHLSDLYSIESIATLPVDEEISEQRRKEINEEIEEAYQKLLLMFKKDNIPYEKDISGLISDIDTYSGDALKKVRERMKIELHDIAIDTKIPIRYLEDLESENFDALPPAVYTRGFVVNYARHLKLDQKKVSDDYMKRYQEWIGKSIP
ncbi:helix-turn-helix domain-containing protein [Thermodesulfobacteriota bacterium]